MNHFLFKKIAIAGIGLIGGSIAAACKEYQLAEECIGIDFSEKHLLFAKQAGWISGTGDIDFATLHDCSLLILCTPVATLPQLLIKALKYLPSSAIVTDVGSTKASLVEAVQTQLHEQHAVFIPAHPIAGSQLSGPQAARHDLFTNTATLLTPLPATPEWALEQLRLFWQALGSTIVEGTPEWHDEMFAEVSHTPHLLASLMIDLIDTHHNADQLWALAGTGLRDFTRIGASDPELWRDISLSNQKAILSSLKRYQQGLNQLIEALEVKDQKKIYTLFNEARIARAKRWI